MKIVLWVVSAVLAVVFLLVGGSKLLLSSADLAKSAHGVPVALLRVAGATEVLGALGLILPAATRILPILTPIAAAALALQMIGANITNIVVGAYSAIPMPAVLMVVLAWIAWLRFGRYAVQPRSQIGNAAPEAT
jgi:uncharacterized membrane protein YphA (DoxX/SURF4 family)